MNPTPLNPRHVANIRRDSTRAQDLKEITYPLLPPDAPHHVCPEAEPLPFPDTPSPVIGMMIAACSGFLVGLALPLIIEAIASFTTNLTLP